MHGRCRPRQGEPDTSVRPIMMYGNGSNGQIVIERWPTYKFIANHGMPVEIRMGPGKFFSWVGKKFPGN
jgi:hypothetical protein